MTNFQFFLILGGIHFIIASQFEDNGRYKTAMVFQVLAIVDIIFAAIYLLVGE